MSRLRGLLGYRGQHRSGAARPLPAWPAPQDPWAEGEALCPWTDTMLLPAVS
ncbi:hypothetical protein QQG74_09265 [Micromonospora sp. FIMYZ51]|uniref:hypothetical protein n=1 Tax=Micromonospora sp. FIMYZ51 TaxID=3051832 RepID=UPI00311E2DB7